MTARPIRVSIAGVTAYTGQEAARLIAGHPGFQLVSASSDAMAGRDVNALLPDLGPDGEATIVGHGDAAMAASDHGAELALLATPPRRCAEVSAELVSRGVRVIDLSGAHRLVDRTAHLAAYGTPRGPDHTALYGLTEWTDTAALRQATLVSNPGGFPCAALLALLPLQQAGLLGRGLIVDAKCGTTGAGRTAKLSLLHSELYDDVHSDRVGCQRHTPEILQELKRHGGGDYALTFAAHLLPVARGILVTLYVDLPEGVDAIQSGHAAREALRTCYAESPFLRILERPEDVHLGAAVRTNRCLIGVVGDPHGHRLVLTSAVDNLLKGGAGQAVQNANLMFGYDMTDGLKLGAGGNP
ncbi:MAG: N-acetyl-gamma-glutamyl-phosphate reductase [Myxococcota bacterium]